MVGFVEILGGEQHIGSVVAQRTDGIPQLDTTARVEAGGRLVEKEQAGRADQARSQVEATPHPTRVGLHQSVPRVGETESLQRGLAGGANPQTRVRRVIRPPGAWRPWPASWRGRACRRPARGGRRAAPPSPGS